MIPTEFPRLLGADADREAQHDVGIEPGLPGRFEQGEGLVEGKRPARPTDLALGRVDQGGHVPADEIMRLGVPNRPRERSPGDLQVPRRQRVTERLKPFTHIAGRQLPERPTADALQERHQGFPGVSALVFPADGLDWRNDDELSGPVHVSPEPHFSKEPGKFVRLAEHRPVA